MHSAGILKEDGASINIPTANCGSVYYAGTANGADAVGLKKEGTATRHTAAVSQLQGVELERTPICSSEDAGQALAIQHCSSSAALDRNSDVVHDKLLTVELEP